MAVLSKNKVVLRESSLRAFTWCASRFLAPTGRHFHPFVGHHDLTQPEPTHTREPGHTGHRGCHLPYTKHYSHDTRGSGGAAAAAAAVRADGRTRTGLSSRPPGRPLLCLPERAVCAARAQSGAGKRGGARGRNRPPKQVWTLWGPRAEKPGRWALRTPVKSALAYHASTSFATKKSGDDARAGQQVRAAFGTV